MKSSSLFLPPLFFTIFFCTIFGWSVDNFLGIITIAFICWVPISLLIDFRLNEKKDAEELKELQQFNFDFSEEKEFSNDLKKEVWVEYRGQCDTCDCKENLRFEYKTPLKKKEQDNSMFGVHLICTSCYKNQNVVNLTTESLIAPYHDCWVELPSWKEFKVRKEDFDIEGLNDAYAGIYITHIFDVKRDSISKAQYNSIQYLVDNADIVRDSILKALFKERTKAKNIYKELMPKINSIEDYKNHIELRVVHISQRKSNKLDEFTYVYFGLNCWDKDNGLGVIMCKDKVIEIEMKGDECLYDKYYNF